jgi:hypothetical protein
VGEQIVMHETTVPVIVNAVSAEDALRAVPDAEVTEEVVILLSARAQDEARDLADRGDFGEAQDRLLHAAKELREVATGSERAEELETQARMFEHRSSSLSAQDYDPFARKQMSYENRLRKQRKQRPPQQP